MMPKFPVWENGEESGSGQKEAHETGEEVSIGQGWRRSQVCLYPEESDGKGESVLTR